MAEENANQAERTEEQKEEKQTVTAEQFAELQKQLEETRKAQSGSDRRVKELTDMLKQKEQEASEAEKTAEQKFAERIAALEAKAKESDRAAQRAQQRSVAIGLLSQEGLKAPGFLDRLIGENEEETQTLIKDYIDTLKGQKLSAAEEFARQNGRTVTDPDKGGYGGMSYKQLVQLPEAEFNKIPQEIIDKAVEAERKRS